MVLASMFCLNREHYLAKFEIFKHKDHDAVAPTGR